MPSQALDLLIQAKELIYKGRYNEAMKILDLITEDPNYSEYDQLDGMILKGRIYCYQERYLKAEKVGGLAFQISSRLRSTGHVIDALLLKAHIVYMGKTDEVIDLLEEAEVLLSKHQDNKSNTFNYQKAEYLLIKSKVAHFQGDHEKALEIANNCLQIVNEKENGFELSRIYWHLARIYLYSGKPDSGLEFALKALNLQKESNNQTGIAKSYFLAGMSHYLSGNFEKALTYCKQNLNIPEISILANLETLHLMGIIYKERGELDRAIKLYNKAADLAELEGYEEEAVINYYGLGSLYRLKGDFNQARDYLQSSLVLSNRIGSIYGLQSSLLHLILLYLDNDLVEKAKDYLDQFKTLSEKMVNNVFYNVYQMAKALVLKKSGRLRDRSEAERILKEIIDEEITTPILYLVTLVNLCELYLEELDITNNLEIINEITPLINKILEVAEKQNAYSWLAETKLLQAKLALVQMNFDEAKHLLIQAQRVAELNGLNLLASKISNEHDNLLDQVNIWDNLKQSDAPLSERIKLASFDGVLNRMKGNRAIIVPQEVREEPILLLIIHEGGVLLFSKAFSEEWDFDGELFSGFLTAINSFFDEVFSVGLDRAKFGDYTVLMNPVANYSILYLFRGKSFQAKKKLKRFTEGLQSDKVIIETIERYYKASVILSNNDIPSLKSLITKVFLN